MMPVNIFMGTCGMLSPTPGRDKSGPYARHDYPHNVFISIIRVEKTGAKEW